METRIARREAALFVIVQALLAIGAAVAAAAEGVDVRHIEDASLLGQAVAYGTALTPLLAAVVARLLTTGSLRGWGFRRVSWRTLLLAWATGLLPVLGAYAAVWATGAGRFDGAAAADALGLAGTPGGTVITAALAGTVLVLPYLGLALVEDLGWRGLLVGRLAQLVRPRTVLLLSGLLWSLSHLWLIVFLGGTPEGVSPAYAIAMFTIATTALGSMLAAMQLRWGIWPGVVAHGTVNAVMYHFADPATAPSGGWTNWIATETGLAYAIAMVITALLFLRWNAAQAADQRPTSVASQAA